MSRMIFVALLAWASIQFPVARGGRVLVRSQNPVKVGDAVWSTKPEKMPDSFHKYKISVGKDQSGFAPFFRSGQSQASVSKAIEYMTSVNSGIAQDPFPRLTSFYVYSSTENAWFRFARTQRHLEIAGEVDRQMIVTVQGGRDSLYCLSSIESRVNCAIVYDLRSSATTEIAAQWFISAKPASEASKWSMFPDLTEHFKGSVTNARDTLLKNNGNGLGTKAFVVRSSRNTAVIHVFQKQHVPQQDRIAFVEAMDANKRPKTYPDHVCPGSSSNVDITRGQVLPFPGASSWMLQLKWTKQGKPVEKSPILDMEDDWHDAIAALNENPGRVRIYFVGHSARTKDWFGSRTGREYDSEKVANMLVRAGLTAARPVTISFVACNAAKFFCPALSRRLSGLGFKQITLHCREPEVARWSGGDLVKKTIITGLPVYKGKGTKTIFRTDAADPGLGTSAYLQLQSDIA
mmetsp:Transcript_96832/g.153340  ORF Transcript_96832/g.153340 Transcript_96832/m.153340 type:complete len:461 (-) Transcript_96832:111-1493(-)